MPNLWFLDVPGGRHRQAHAFDIDSGLRQASFFTNPTAQSLLVILSDGASQGLGFCQMSVTSLPILLGPWVSCEPHESMMAPFPGLNSYCPIVSGLWSFPSLFCQFSCSFHSMSGLIYLPRTCNSSTLRLSCLPACQSRNTDLIAVFFLQCPPPTQPP